VLRYGSQLVHIPIFKHVRKIAKSDS